MDEDQKQLNLLVMFHYIVGGIALLFSCFPVIHVVIGYMMVFHPEKMMNGKGGPPPPFFGWIFLAMGSAFILMGLTYSICLICAGRSLAARTRYLFCMVMAGLSCLFIPFGTILGVFTIVTLQRASVKALFKV